MRAGTPPGTSAIFRAGRPDTVASRPPTWKLPMARSVIGGSSAAVTGTDEASVAAATSSREGRSMADVPVPSLRGA